MALAFSILKGNGMNMSQGEVASATNDLLLRDDANTILRDRYPTDEEFHRLPLGELLKSIPDVDPRYGMQPNGKPGHGEGFLRA